MNTSNKKYYPVRWENGMKLNKEVFQHQYNTHTYHDILWSRTNVNAYAYGLFLTPEDYDVHLSYDNQHTLHLRVVKLTAVTAGGYMIDIDAAKESSAGMESQPFSVNAGADLADGEYYLVLLALPFDKTQIALLENSNTTDVPSAPTRYEVQLLARESMQSLAAIPNGLVVGAVVVQNKKVSVNDNFIPAVMLVNAHADVLQWYAALMKVLENIDYKSIQIIQKIIQKGQQNELSRLVHKLCESVSAVLNIHLSRCTIANGNIAVLELMTVLSSLARSIKNAVDMNIGTGKEELMNYLSEWVNISPGTFEETLTKVATVRYDSIDTNNNINSVNYFITTVNHLFDTLHKLDFIGKKKDAGLFIKEENTGAAAFQASAEEQAKPKRRFFGY